MYINTKIMIRVTLKNYTFVTSITIQMFHRQGKVHARVSVSWAAEFGAILRLPLKLE